MASGEIPSRTAAVGAMPPLAPATWTDDGLDRAWRDPSSERAAPRDRSLSSAARRRAGRSDVGGVALLQRAVARPIDVGVHLLHRRRGRYRTAQWGGQVLVTLHDAGRAVAPLRGDRSARAPFDSRRLDADLTIGDVERGGARRTGATPFARTRARRTGPDVVRRESRRRAVAGRVFPRCGAVERRSSCRATSFPACAPTRPDRSASTAAASSIDGAQSYHDHNWGVWRGVTWEWGAARAGPYTVLYGRVQSADSAVASQPLFVYVVDSLGFLALFRPREIRYEDARVDPRRRRDDHTFRRAATMVDVRGDDTLRIELTIEDATATDTRTPGVERGEGLSARQLARPYFVQMKGLMRISGRVLGRPLESARVPGSLRRIGEVGEGGWGMGDGGTAHGAYFGALFHRRPRSPVVLHPPSPILRPASPSGENFDQLNLPGVIDRVTRDAEDEVELLGLG